jgi:hypothetical protein
MPEDDNSYRQFANTCAGIYPPDDFEGLLVRYNPRTHLLEFRGYFDKGLKRQGQHLFFWESGALQEVSHWKDGWATGTLIRYHENGAREIEIHYGVDGGRKRKFVEIHFGHLSDDIFSVWEMNAYEIVREWKGAEDARRWKEIEGDKIVEDAVREMQLDDVTKHDDQDDDDELE